MGQGAATGSAESKVRKYANVFPDSTIPGPLRAEVIANLSAWLGKEAEAHLPTGIADMILNSCTPSTWSTYLSAFRKFVRFCESHNLIFLPASECTVLKYALFLAEEGQVKASASTPFFSAINKIHSVLGYSLPAESALLKKFKAGWARVQILSESPISTLLANEPCLPADIAQRMYQMLPLLVRGSDDWRSMLYAVFAFRIFLRPSTLTSIYWSSFRDSGGRQTLAFKATVWKDAVRKGLSRERSPALDLTNLPNLRDALQWAVQDCKGTNFLFYKTPERGNLAFQRALILAAPTLTTVYTQYSCRRGGVSAAYAAGVPIDVCEVLGGWSVGSRAMRDHYIDRSIGFTEAGKFFFASLVPGQAAALFSTPCFG